MVNEFERKLKEASSLTKTETIIANYFLDHINSIYLKTASDLAMDIGVSDTSIIRFIRTLGYSGYTEFQKSMKNELFEQTGRASTPSDRFQEMSGKTGGISLSEKLLGYTIENLQKTCEKIDIGLLEKAASTIVKSKNKYIVGFRDTASLVDFMESKLLYLLPGISKHIHADSSVIEKFADLTKDDCVIIYSFPRHSSIFTTLTNMAKEKGASIIVITDKVTAPIVKQADIILTAYVESLGFSNSYIAPLWLTELLLLTISSKVPEEEKNRKEYIDSYIELENVY